MATQVCGNYDTMVRVTKIILCIRIWCITHWITLLPLLLLRGDSRPLESERLYISSKLKDLLDRIVTLVKLVLTKSFVIPIPSSLFFKIEFSFDIHACSGKIPGV